MEFGCIGEKLGHSYSVAIHEAISAYDYVLCEVARDDLDRFMTERDFNGINVTIPYKQAVIPYLKEISEGAKRIGAVNTIVNKGGDLYGYNTDHFGMTSLIERAGMDMNGAKVMILGTGGTSKTARIVAADLGAKEVIVVSRTKSDETVSYEEAYEKHSDAEFIINTTPCGMFPNTETVAIEPERFKSLKGVVDAVYNPLRTELVSRALKMGVTAVGGLYMLVAQAVRAYEIFTGETASSQLTESIFRKITNGKENIVLTGMPGSGKSSIGKYLSKELGRAFLDTDELIVKKTGMDIPDIFKAYGEKFFRDKEAEVIEETARNERGVVIATGGGAVLREENVVRLKRNGRIYFLDRPLEDLVPTDDRPLSSTRADIEKRYSERMPVYTATCDARIDNGGSIQDASAAIVNEFFDERTI